MRIVPITSAATLIHHPRALAFIRHFLNSKSSTRFAASAARIAARLRSGEEGQEGLRAFLEKRSPSWR